MSMMRKLKPDRNITGLVPALALFAILAIALLAFGLRAGLKVAAAAIWLHAAFYLLVFVRTGNGPHLLSFAYQVFLGAYFLYLPDIFTAGRSERITYSMAYLSGLVFFGVLLAYLLLNRKIKWRGREIFELAAEPIEETGNGYTSRPRPVGKVEYSREEISSFARFAARRLIALPYISTNNITLVPVKMGEEYGRLLGLSGDYRDATWVNFDIDGNVSVNIAQNDYLDYRQPLAFDPLCKSFGQLFVEFIDLHRRGEGVRIIDRLDGLKLSIFS